MKERGICSSYREYVDLPLGVLLDARLLMVAEAQKKEIDGQRGRR